MRLTRAILFGLATAALVAMVGQPVTLAADEKLAKKEARLKAKAEAAKKAAEEAKKAEEAKAAPAKPVSPPPAPVKTEKQDLNALIKMIDKFTTQKLEAEKIPSSAKCTDEEFLRRVSLDIAGVIPSAERAKSFLDDKSPDKRAKLIDELLESPNYGRKQADIWQAKLFPRDSNNRFVLREPFVEWLKSEFNKNTPWNTFVSNLVSATGSVQANPAVTYFLANRSVDKLTDTTTQHFLGVRLACAQCHNHPFTTTKQAEYWGMAAFYSKVQIDNPKNANKGADNTTLGVREGTTPTKLKDFFPESAMKVSAKFLGGDEPKLSSSEPSRPALAKWMTAAENPLFSKAMVNRTWAMLFGNGIVDPVDDLIDRNKPSHPELFNELAKHFAATGFDVKYLIRGICNSETYQRSAKPTGDNKDDNQFFSHMNIKVMSAEQLFDSLAMVTGSERDAGVKGKPAAAPKGQPNSARDRFVTFFLAGAEENNLTEYEAGIPQALRLMNSKVIGNPNAVRGFMTGGSKPADVIEKIYLAALSRRPTADETARLTKYVATTTTPAEAYSDILWAVLNSSEFTLIR